MVVTFGNPYNRFGGSERDSRHAVQPPASSPYRALDVVMQYDRLADRPTRRGWYSALNARMSRHYDYFDADINDPSNLVYRDGATTHMLIEADVLPLLKGWDWLLTDERMAELDAKYRPLIERDYDRPAYVEQGPGADWGNGVEPAVLRDNEEESWSEPLAGTGSANGSEPGGSTTLEISDGSDKLLDESESSTASKSATHSRRTSKQDDAETEISLSDYRVDAEPGQGGGNEQSEGAEPSSGADIDSHSADQDSPTSDGGQDTPDDSADSESGGGDE